MRKHTAAFLALATLGCSECAPRDRSSPTPTPSLSASARPAEPSSKPELAGSCALVDGRVWCWRHVGLSKASLEGARREPGREQRLGIEGADCRAHDNDNMLCFRAPRLLEAAPRFAAIRAFQYATCGRTSDGRVHCWDTSATSDGEPSAIPLKISAVSELLGGATLLCARRGKSTLECLGYPGAGLIMNGSVHPELKMESIPLLEDVVDLRASIEHACALDRKGGVTCWNRPGGSARRIPLPDAARQIAMNLARACALTATGRIACWSTLDPPTVTEAAVRDASMIGVGFGWSCALRKDRSVACFDNSGVVPVSGVDDAVAIDSGTNVTCALSSDKRVSCWEAGHFFRLRARPTFLVFSGVLRG